MKNEDKPIFSDEELQKIKEAIESGLSNLQTIYATEVPEEKFDLWYTRCGGADLITKWRVMRTAPAIKMFHKPTNHKEAEAVLRRHPDTKKDYSDRTEVTGAEGKELTPILVKFIDGNTNSD